MNSAVGLNEHRAVTSIRPHQNFLDPNIPRLDRFTLAPRNYRTNRKLNPDELAELVALYQAGASLLELSRKFETHRHTVVAYLRRAGVAVRPQKKMTPDLVAKATAFYSTGHSLVDVGWHLGLEASTIGKALKRTGVQLRPPVADRWHGSRDE